MKNCDAMTVLTITNLTKNYDEISVLKGINLSVDAGEFVAIMGSSGSGKSTLLNIISSIDTPSGGSITILNNGNMFTIDEKTSKKERIHLRRNVTSIVFQSFNLLDQLTALENVMLPLTLSGTSHDEAKQKAVSILQRMGLKNRMNHLPEDLSGGEKQRVAIGRALITEAKLILADEPTGNLDSKTGLEMIQVFKELKSEGISTLFVTHDSNLAKQADKIYILKQGILKTKNNNNNGGNDL